MTPEVKSARKEKKNQFPISLRKKIALGVTAFAITAAGVGVATQAPKFLNSESGQTEVAGTILDRNSFTTISQEEEKSLWENTKIVDLENHTFTMGFPFDQETVDKNSSIKLDQKFQIRSAYTFVQELKNQGVKNVNIFRGLSKGDQFNLIYDENKYEASIMTVTVAGVKSGEGEGSYTPAYTSFIVFFRDKSTGEKLGAGLTIQGLLANPLINVKLPPYGSNRNFIFEDGIPVVSGTAILELTTDLQDWNGNKAALLPGEEGQFAVRSRTKQKNPQAPIPLTGIFLSTADSKIVSARSDGAVDYGNGVIGPTPEDVQRANSGK